MITLGLDPSLTAFGWSINDSEASGLARRVASGHEETLPTTVPVARFIHYRSMVKRLLNTFEPHLGFIRKFNIPNRYFAEFKYS